MSLIGKTVELSHNGVKCKILDKVNVKKNHSSDVEDHYLVEFNDDTILLIDVKQVKKIIYT